jgi:hypothetical protein
MYVTLLGYLSYRNVSFIMVIPHYSVLNATDKNIRKYDWVEVKQIVGFVDIGLIVDHHCLNFLFPTWISCFGLTDMIKNFFRNWLMKLDTNNISNSFIALNMKFQLEVKTRYRNMK